jgi:hypothetical protein
VEVFVSRLRQQLSDGAKLEGSGRGYRLRVDVACVDVAVMEQLRASAARARARGDLDAACGFASVGNLQRWFLTEHLDQLWVQRMPTASAQRG